MVKDMKVRVRTIQDKPPIPVKSRPSSGNFHYRGNLFTSTYNNKLYQSPDVTVDKETHGNTREPEASRFNTSFESKSFTAQKHSCISSPNRRVQSAKGRLTERNKNTAAHTVSRTKSRQRPFSANDKYRLQNKNGDFKDQLQRNESNDHSQIVLSGKREVAIINICDKVSPDLFEIQRKKVSDCQTFDIDIQVQKPWRPASAKSDLSQSFLYQNEVETKEKEADLKPSVYGLKNQRQVYGSTPNLQDANVTYQSFPYKLADDNNQHSSNMQLVVQRPIPQTLLPLQPWLTESDGRLEEVIGMDPTRCLVFLPLLPEDIDDLPEVPEPHAVEEDLPFTDDLTSPGPWNPKKYPHPFYENREPVEEWICKHKGKCFDDPFDEENWIGQCASHYQTAASGQWKLETVRKEIQDLENLMRGLGTADSDCMIARYQAEITKLQNDLVLAFEMCPQDLLHPKEPVDTFGLRKFYKEHDEILSEIRERHAQCLKELAVLEKEAGIETDRQHFNNRGPVAESKSDSKPEDKKSGEETLQDKRSSEDTLQGMICSDPVGGLLANPKRRPASGRTSDKN
ncbi:hypothetical protein CHS0354_033235 [Potamilus streckersoni]|uniref:Uncharacterized protein n=1 Tax=Potamilus streckersoni TaxID=2493646 RepID=A0AAE0VR38_9BIVA|nr:hypothetical protein CHS0354_033235 [Potamilus streckersoni]